jgi:transketolase
MRSVFFDLLRQAMREDARGFLLIADMGMGLVDPIQQEFPNRFLNVGIAEQNMIGVSAGLCNLGFHPICYTISNFLVHRCCEQIRNDICLHNYPVTLVGTSTGFDNGSLGPTHHVVDDIACLKSFPNLNIYSPVSVQGVRATFKDIMRRQGPAYVRIGKGAMNLEQKTESLNHMAAGNSESQVLLLTHGNVFEYCLAAAQKDGRLGVYCMNKIRPLEKSDLEPLLRTYRNILVVEDQVCTGGLYNMICQYMVQSRIQGCRLDVIALPEQYVEKVGDRNFYADNFAFSSEKIIERVGQILDGQVKAPVKLARV